MTVRRCARALLVVLLAAGCSGGGGSSSSTPPLSGPTPRPTSGPGMKIQHVVVIIQENRSFDNFFATYPGADGTTTGKTHDGKTVKLVKANLVSKDLNHMHSGFVSECDLQGSTCKMDGFDTIGFGASGQNGAAGTYPYRYVDPTQIAPYWTMAKQYVLADHMFQTQGSGSFTGHQDLIRGDTAINDHESIIDSPSRPPWGCDAPNSQSVTTHTSLLTDKGEYLFNKGPFPCFSYATLRDVLDAKGVSWRYYVPPLVPGSTGYLWNAFDAIHAVRYSPEWKANVISPETQVLKDAAAGQLPAVSWVIPDANNSDHPYAHDTGPSWVSQIVDAVGGSSQWNTTAIIVVWDDWGGFFDHVPPPQLDYQGLGFRVPMLVVSPYAKHGYVSHTQYEFASILRFIEDNWKLDRIGSADERAASIADCFDFHQHARGFVPLRVKYSRAFFLRQRPSYQPVDDE
ncbi:MAG TPA: alkaline phosphatase family protein [Candidatus Tumulicola sp.]